MRHSLFLFFTFIIVFPNNLFSANPYQKQETPLSYKINESIFEQLSKPDIISLDRMEIEHKYSLKLTLKEKVILKVVKRKLLKDKDMTLEDALYTTKYEGLAIAGFIAGIVGLIAFGIILGAAAIIMSSIALGRISGSSRTVNEKQGKGMAIAGAILGVVDIIGALIAISMMV